jgi:hypothetical protein
VCPHYRPRYFLGEVLDAEMIGYLFVCSVGIFLLFGGLYCDWILAAIAGNWGGLPSSDVAALYWIYFVSKRLPMFSV